MVTGQCALAREHQDAGASGREPVGASAQPLHAAETRGLVSVADGGGRRVEEAVVVRGVHHRAVSSPEHVSSHALEAVDVHHCVGPRLLRHPGRRSEGAEHVERVERDLGGGARSVLVGAIRAIGRAHAHGHAGSARPLDGVGVGPRGEDLDLVTSPGLLGGQGEHVRLGPAQRCDEAALDVRDPHLGSFPGRTLRVGGSVDAPGLAWPRGIVSAHRPRSHPLAELAATACFTRPVRERGRGSARAISAEWARAPRRRRRGGST